MAKIATLKIMRGDGVTRLVKVPISLYSAGAVLGFSAKPVVDNDTGDSAAVINKQFTDSSVDLVSDPNYAIYSCTFIPADTLSIAFDEGVTENHYFGQFQYKTLTSDPKSYPADNNYIDVVVYADVRRLVP